jgi:hypothetical protein
MAAGTLCSMSAAALAARTSGIEPDRPACTLAAQWLLGVEEHARRGWPVTVVRSVGLGQLWAGGRVVSSND